MISTTKHKFSWLADKRLEGNKTAESWGEAGPDLRTGETSYRLWPHITSGLCEAASLKEKEKLKACGTKITIQKN